MQHLYRDSFGSLNSNTNQIRLKFFYFEFNFNFNCNGQWLIDCKKENVVLSAFIETASKIANLFITDKSLICDAYNSQR